MPENPQADPGHPWQLQICSRLERIERLLEENGGFALHSARGGSAPDRSSGKSPRPPGRSFKSRLRLPQEAVVLGAAGLFVIAAFLFVAFEFTRPRPPVQPPLDPALSGLKRRGPEDDRQPLAEANELGTAGALRRSGVYIPTPEAYPPALDPAPETIAAGDALPHAGALPATSGSASLPGIEPFGIAGDPSDRSGCWAVPVEGPDGQTGVLVCEDDLLAEVHPVPTSNATQGE